VTFSAPGSVIIFAPLGGAPKMNLVQKFIESEAEKAFHGYREKLDTWLSTVDIDGNGETDKQQILADFDRIRDGLMDVVGGLTDLHRLARQYYDRYGHEITGAEPPKKA
jgi:hypothetical protein